ncbi:atlastin-3-like [Tachyglossus aculeatus]|uniref:atlastin-3-like n=1 Tax=Tachyglossus aculeatus TaxID=9261 RepID=UPI0018F70743|nr:atlastin-3-like [Tachyglossus aculeatus]
MSSCGSQGQALQLLEIKGKVFQLNEDVLKETLERKEVQDLPVCVISIFGEQRKGKSFLLNYLWRRLEHEEKSHDAWMGKNKEILKGFEWRMWVEPTTRGLWICSKPFILKGKSAKEVAVFLVDTEGTMDVAGNKENSVKISTLNMLFSSYLEGKSSQVFFDLLATFPTVITMFISKAFYMPSLNFLFSLVNCHRSTFFMNSYGIGDSKLHLTLEQQRANNTNFFKNFQHHSCLLSHIAV